MKKKELIKNFNDIVPGDMFAGDMFGSIFYHRFLYVKEKENDILILKFLDTHDTIKIKKQFFEKHLFIYYGSFIPSTKMVELEQIIYNTTKMIEMI